MPTYTYRCQKCGEEVEVVQSMTDPPLKRCKSCRGALKRTFHPVGIVLKGSGFYKTDYGGGRGGSDRGSSSSSSDDSTTSSEGSTESKDTKSSKDSKDSSKKKGTGSD